MLCVIGKLSETATKKLIELQERTKKIGIIPKKLYGHITIISYMGGKEEEFIQHCKRVLCDQKVFEVLYEKLEVLSQTDIIVASPAKAGVLMDIHDRLAAGYDEYLDGWSQKAVWQPHTTLFYHPEMDLEGIAQTMRAGFAPFWAQIERIEFSKVTEAGYDIIDRMELISVETKVSVTGNLGSEYRRSMRNEIC